MSGTSEKPKYQADGLTTHHYVPFINDDRFNHAYRMALSPLDPQEADVRYRGYVIQWAVSQVREISGHFVECGTYNAKAATLILNLEDLRAAGRKFLLFDTFSGIPRKGLTPNEIELGYEGRFNDVTLSEVQEKLKDYVDSVEFHVGIIPDTLEGLAYLPVAFLHIDLNGSYPTQKALDCFYPWLVKGGIIVFDDYGWDGYEEQRIVIDHFFADKLEKIFALPTGQGLVIKK
ncbi:MAG: class I SAM-dependent methyltransferase [Desulfobacterales bacterium]|nr:class I SAM-dependent methyltransferase [Desulfobacterales bacterium]